jgi:hypothetical protein
MREAKPDARGEAGQILEARPGRCARQGREDARAR